MEVRDWVTIVSVIAVISGWFINGNLNRKHEIFKKRLDYKLDMYRSYFDTASLLEKLIQNKSSNSVKMQTLTNEFIRNLEACQIKFLMFGDADEIKGICEITLLASNNKHQELKQKSAIFIASIRNKLRGEIGVDKI